MKRYMLFETNQNDTMRGGIFDLCGFYNTSEEAWEDAFGNEWADGYHVYDTETGLVQIVPAGEWNRFITWSR